MTKKRAQFGLDSLMSYFVFAFFFIFTMMALMLSGCGSDKKKVERGLEVDKGVMAELRASEQLSAYLSTAVPEKGLLYERIGEVNGKFKVGTSFDQKKAEGFLDEHPEVYVDKTYGGFISALYAYRGDARVRDVFDAVTKSMFYSQLASKSKREANEGRLDSMYYSPTISVIYSRQREFYHANEKLTSVGVVSVYSKTIVFKTLPTHDLNGVTVSLEVYQEDLSEPVP